MRRRACWWLAGVALVVGAMLLTDRLLWEPGMTLAEVEALLGGPAADSFEMPADWPAYRWQREWREGSADVVVRFTAGGKVMSAAGRGRPRAGILAPLRAWLAGLAGNLPHDAGNLK
jgi:hypothetical protein